MSIPKFNNRLNRQATADDVGKAWLSRSCAVVCLVFLETPGVTFVLMNKRGPGAPDNVGKWVLPCGYLDYDETLAEGAVRETFEETGINVQDFGSFQGSSFQTGQPVYVNSKASDPTNPVQNVSNYFKIVEQYKAEELPETSTEYCEPGEVDEVRWVDITKVQELDVAFNHTVRVAEHSSDLRWR